MRMARAIAGLFVCLFTLVSSTAQAADPPSGTLSKSKRSISWSGSFTLSQPNPASGCLGGNEDPICDRFMLKINLPDGARIRIDLPSPDAVTDLDLFVYAPTGAEVGSSGEIIGEAERVEFRHSGRYRNKVYIVEVRPFIVVPGTAYKGTAKVR